jgi:hypothetical protein
MARRSKPALKAIRAGRVNNDSEVPRLFQKIPTRNLMRKKGFWFFINSTFDEQDRKNVQDAFVVLHGRWRPHPCFQRFISLRTQRVYLTADTQA